MAGLSFNLEVGDVNLCFTPSTIASNISVSGGGYDNEKNWSDVTAIFSSFNGTLRVSLAEKKISSKPKDGAAKLASKEINDVEVFSNVSNNGSFERANTHDKPDIILCDANRKQFEQSDFSFHTCDLLLNSNPNCLQIACKSSRVSCKELLAILRKYPQCASVPDQYGKLPLHDIAENVALFESSKRETLNYVVQKVYNAYPDAIKTRDNDGRFPFTNAIADWASGCRFRETPNIDAPSHEATIHTSRYGLSVNFFMDPIVEWCFSSLSILVEDMKELSFGSSYSILSTEFSETTVEVVDNVESIPNILRIILLIHDENSLKNIYDMSLFRRLCLRRTSLETMLLPMLKGNSQTTSRAIDYLELISDPDYAKFFGLKSTPNQTDVNSFFRKQEAQFKAISEIDDFISCLSLVNNDEAERATATHVVRWIMDVEMIKREMSVKVFLEITIHLLYLLSSRTVIMTGIPSTSISTITIICGLYFSVRNFMVALYTISSCRDLLLFLYDFWHLTDMLSDILPVTTILLMIFNHSEVDPNFGAFILGLLWLKCIGFFKTVNKQFATFIFIVGKITKDIKYFLLVMFASILMFTDMEYCVVSGGCKGANCPNIEWSPLRFYNILMGDTNDFQDEKYWPEMIIYIIFSVVGVVVMCNVLIAIVSESYNNSVSSSQGVLGRARMVSVATKLAVNSVCKNIKEKVKEKCGFKQVVDIFLSLEMFIILFSVSMNIIVFKISDFTSKWNQALFYLLAILLIFGTLIAVGPIFISIKKVHFSENYEKFWDLPTAWIAKNIMDIHPDDQYFQSSKRKSLEACGKTSELEKIIKRSTFTTEHLITKRTKLLEAKIMDIISGMKSINIIDEDERTVNDK